MCRMFRCGGSRLRERRPFDAVDFGDVSDFTIHWAYRMRLRSNPPQPVELDRKAILIGGRDER